jgi:hypothetical protein
MQNRDPANQFEWHESYRDMMKNMYRTSYTDGSHFREINVKSDFPAGYGGHVPVIRHDVLHRNTALDRTWTLNRNDPNRDAMPSFVDQISGVPSVTKRPCGATRNPTYKVNYRDGTTNPLAPWGITVNRNRDKLCQRSMPPTLKRAISMGVLERGRSNEAAKQAGSMMASGSAGALDQYAPAPARGEEMLGAPHQLSPTQEKLRKTVDDANYKATEGHMPTETEVLVEGMQM